MPTILSYEDTLEKQRLNSTAALVPCLEIIIPGVTEHIYVTINTDPFTWRDIEWMPFPFEIEDFSTGTDGSVPQVEVRVSNVDRRMEAYVLEYDTWVKQNGPERIVVNMFVVNTGNLSSDTPMMEAEFELKEPKMDEKWVYFTLGASNPFDIRAPLERIFKNACRFKFKSTLCGYAGPETECGKTLAWCRKYNNSARFGSFPGIGRAGFYAGYE